MPYERPKGPQSIDAIQVSLASPKKILEWSFGEVKKPETINYRTFKPEKDGLFCARIFGPVRDYECLCGKYKRLKHRGMVCEKCGVEVIESKVRRDRMAHVALAAPVAHIWFLKSIPSRIGNILDMTLKEVESVLYFAAYIVIEPGSVKDLKKGEVISEGDYYNLLDEYDEDDFKVGIGAEAIRQLLEEVDIDALAEDLRGQLKEVTSEAKQKKLSKRLKIVESIEASNNRPEWMILKNLPVLPPDLRPLVPLDGGRFATSDLNDLYRRVINRNNRLQRLQELDAPDIIVRNEKRMLQEAVDALFDNGRRGRVVTGTNKRPLKSLSEALKGKTGRFRQNLLGKRVDYSGRSVIVVGPSLKLHECGLPKKMALELFKPFIYNKLEELGYATTIKTAKKVVDDQNPVIWDILADVSREHPVMLNRAPTLHRLGMQAFEPVLIEGKAIRLHPLSCVAFNADFDGDQMAVHLPLSLEAQAEARALMMSSNNVLKPADGKAVITPTQDMVLGFYYLTRNRPFVKGTGMVFSSPEEVRIAFDQGVADMHASIKVRIDGKLRDSTVGRTLITEIMPKSVPFEEYNKVLDKKGLAALIDYIYHHSGSKDTVIAADRIRTWGYNFATKSGISIGVKDMKIPKNKHQIINKTQKEIAKIEADRDVGNLSESERYNNVVDAWSRTTDAVAKEMLKDMSIDVVEGPNGEKVEMPSFNPIYIMADSGARGSESQMKQLAGMRGLVGKPSGEIIETPIVANLREGLSVLEYFISTHGARKGLADTALKTANSGYLTRRLVDVAQDVVVKEYDCGTLDGLEVSALVTGGEIREPLEDRIAGRIALDDIIDPYTNEVIVAANNLIDRDKAHKITEAGIDKVKVRSVLSCRSKVGVCVLCYGQDMARDKLINVGEAVGVIGAQSIGEPGTQLTMRTFHSGGAAGVVQQSSIETNKSGIVHFDALKTIKRSDDSLVVMSRSGEIVIKDEQGRERDKYQVPYGATLSVEEGDKVEVNQTVAHWDPWSNPILTEVAGKVKFQDLEEGVSYEESLDQTTGLTKKTTIDPRESNLKPRLKLTTERGHVIKVPGTKHEASYSLPVRAIIMVNEGDMVEAGSLLAKIPKETTKMRDITGGLPRVVELFEARKPKDHAIISEIDGTVTISTDAKAKGKTLVTVEPEIGLKRDYLIPKGKYISLRDGDFVRAGSPLMEGSPDPHEMLRVLGVHPLAQYLVDEVQQVYRLQGVRIHDKHIEVVVRQMLRWVRVMDIGDSKFLEGEYVDKWIFDEENERMMKAGKQPASSVPTLLGITKASLNVESFLSAASFQETTKVLTEASLSAKTDYLKGLKENVLIGGLVPAGTGFPALRRQVEVKVMEPELSTPQDS